MSQALCLPGASLEAHPLLWFALTPSRCWFSGCSVRALEVVWSPCCKGGDCALFLRHRLAMDSLT